MDAILQLLDVVVFWMLAAGFVGVWHRGDRVVVGNVALRPVAG